MDYREESLKLHEENKGKITICSKVEIKDSHDLSLAYSPGVAEPCKAIHANKEDVYKYTTKSNLIAVVSDGSAVLGLGDIGPEAAMPVMEGKAILFKEFGDVDAVPICLATKDVDEIVETVKRLEPTFGGINLEDISAPRCFEIEEKLKKVTNIPIFHDDQHGTAIVTTAGLINALKVVGKKLEESKIVVNGSGAAGGAIVRMFEYLGAENILVCDSKGIIYEGREGNNWAKEEIAKITNTDKLQGTLADAVKDADVFVGVSTGNILTQDMIRTMAKDPIIFAMANPVPEVFPDVAKEAGAKVVGTGRSDYPNQINNILAFPGLFRGALDARASDISNGMNIAAAKAIADSVSADELDEDFIIPNALDKKVAKKVAEAVKQAAIDEGLSRI